MIRQGLEVDKAMREFFGDKGPGPANGNIIDSDKRAAFKEAGYHRRNLREKSRDHPRRRRRGGDEDATEGPELEEAMKRRKERLDAIDKRIRNKVFRDDEKYHPKNRLSPLFPMMPRHALPPVWPSVHLINDKLKDFCSKHESITFFDATPIFATSEGGGRHRLHNELISPRGHPSGLGFAIWERNIMAQLHKMTLKMTEKNDKPSIQDELEEDTDLEVLSPFSTMGSADFVPHSGDGSEHVSDGKESGPPPKVEQPRRSDPSKDKEIKEGDDGANDDDKKHISAADEDDKEGDNVKGGDDEGDESDVEDVDEGNLEDVDEGDVEDGDEGDVDDGDEGDIEDVDEGDEADDEGDVDDKE